MREKPNMTHTPQLITDFSPTVRKRLRTIYEACWFDEPIFEFTVPDPQHRRKAIGGFADRILLLRHVQGCLTYATGDTEQAIKGFAMWFEPGVPLQATAWQQLRCGLLTLPFDLGPGGFRRMLKFGAHADALMARFNPGNQLYVLDVIGVDPAFQRQGLGAPLMQPGFEGAAAAGKECLVITHNQRNVQFYTKYGFALQFEDPVERGGPVAYVLRRKKLDEPLGFPVS